MFGKTKVSQLEVAILKYENVLGFEIPVDNSFPVEILKPKYDATKNKSDSILSSLLKTTDPGTILLDNCIEIASLSPLHDKIVVIWISEGAVETGDEGTLSFFQNLFFHENILLEMHFFDIPFWHSFYCIFFAVLRVSC